MIIQSLQEFYSSLTTHSPLLAIDFGLRKIGVAISDHNKMIAMPIEVASFQDDKARIKYIAELIAKHKACGLVIGLPIKMDGTYSDQTHMVVKFVKKLSCEVSIPIFMQDERLSSAAANSLLREAGMNRRDRNEVDDKIAASLILETVLKQMT